MLVVKFRDGVSCTLLFFALKSLSVNCLHLMKISKLCIFKVLLEMMIWADVLMLKRCVMFL